VESHVTPCSEVASATTRPDEGQSPSHLCLLRACNLYCQERSDACDGKSSDAASITEPAVPLVVESGPSIFTRRACRLFWTGRERVSHCGASCSCRSHPQEPYR
jgi:hypothetical protein